MEPLYLCGSALLWSHPKGILLKWSTLRSAAGIDWPVTLLVTEVAKELNSKVRHQPVPPYISSAVFSGCFSGGWPLPKGVQSFWGFGADIAVTYLLRGLLWILTIGRLQRSQKQAGTSCRLHRARLTECRKLNRGWANMRSTPLSLWRLHPGQDTDPCSLHSSCCTDRLLPRRWWKWTV